MKFRMKQLENKEHAVPFKIFQNALRRELSVAEVSIEIAGGTKYLCKSKYRRGFQFL